MIKSHVWPSEPIMLCSRSTVNDIKLSHHHLHSSSSTTSSSSSPTRIGCTGGGSSGSHHAKRNSKVVGLLTTTAAPTTTSDSISNNPKLKYSASSKSGRNGSRKSNQNHNHVGATDTVVKYRKIKQCFFSKSLTTSPTSASSETVGRRCQVVGGRKGSGNNTNITNNIGIRSKCVSGSSGKCAIVVRDSNKQIDIASLDPPLPVVKRRISQDKQGTESSLWERRSGGRPALKCLQVQSFREAGTVVVGGSSDDDSTEANTV